ncbi:hypothetical protein ANCCAN_14006 [Ancylostoma caninum]|uniref:Uncharacterized protein n=1 Tax=Ancylostoma caninum TaxID=29170 RepID=A0A368G6K9_ANCCA|nr:hypothetical protein ANCCAN_14006 [Ancylostoma caninum]
MENQFRLRNRVIFEGNDMLCKEPIEKWQNVLKLSAEFFGNKEHVFETITSSGVHCGDIRTQKCEFLCCVWLSLL